MKLLNINLNNFEFILNIVKINLNIVDFMLNNTLIFEYKFLNDSFCSIRVIKLIMFNSKTCIMKNERICMITLT